MKHLTWRHRVVAPAVALLATIGGSAALVTATTSNASGVTPVTTEAEFRQAWANDADVVLGANITLTCQEGDTSAPHNGTSEAVRNVAGPGTLDGKGFTITQSCPESRVLQITGETGAMTIQNVTVTGGQAVWDTKSGNGGGGIQDTTSSPLTVVNSTISNNVTCEGGGAIEMDYSGDLTVSGSTFNGNTGVSGNITDYGGTVKMTNSTVTGNTAIFKPSERTPATGWLLADLLAEHLPEGVLVALAGDGQVGSALVARGVDVVAHVGSSATGRRIAKLAAQTGAKVLLENGGNDPLIVDEDVDPRWAAGQAATGAFANAGQLCVAVERIYVHERLAEAFLAELAARAGEIVLGSGLDEGTGMGPLVDRELRELVHEQVGEAVRTGARVLAGGWVPDGPGAFYPPTVLADCTDRMRIMREETFGPVAPVAVVGSFEEALARASAGEYGLAASVLTGSMAHAQQAWRELPAGTVKINNVFGGAPGGAAHPRGASGQGYGYGPELLDEFTATKVVNIEPAPA